MGKHERALIEQAEKIIVKILRIQRVTKVDERNRWFIHACSLAGKIKKDFPRMNSVSHLGNCYDNTGDILLVSRGKKFFIEIKMSDKKAGIGTMANISQNALTDNGLFRGNVKGWSKFREDKKHDVWVNNYLDKYSSYPQDILVIKNPTKKKEEKARYLRKLTNKGNKKTKAVLNAIRDRDKKEKIDYLHYLSEQKQRPEMIKRFFALITLGIHTQEILNDLIKKKDFLKEIQNLVIYYANTSNKEIVVRKEDAGKRIAGIIGEYSSFRIIFLKDLTHCKIVGVKGKIQKPLQQIVFHWKNIAQGIKTPCLNIFDLTNRED